MKGDAGDGSRMEWVPRFGSVAVEMGYATFEQVKSAIGEQVDDNIHKKPHRPLGRILFERDWMSHSEVEMVLNEIFKRKRVMDPQKPF